MPRKMREVLNEVARDVYGTDAKIADLEQQLTEKADLIGHLRLLLRRTIQAMGGVAEPGVSDEFLSLIPAEAGALKRAKDKAEKDLAEQSAALAEMTKAAQANLDMLNVRQDELRDVKATLRAVEQLAVDVDTGFYNLAMEYCHIEEIQPLVASCRKDSMAIVDVIRSAISGDFTGN